MKKVKFCFGIHNHQPVGNFGWVIEEAFQKSYRPFLELVARYPKFRFSLHFTGILYKWIDEFHPEFFGVIRRLIEQGQVELLTGGFYEPILPSIPDRDKIGQIRMESDFIETKFGVRPEGMWLAERVWEPGLARILNEAGVKYTILDDIHFRYSGLESSQLDGYYLTEDQGKQVALFPIAKKLRYTIPFADPEETIAYMRELASEKGDSLAIYADDGEKFGVWPHTYEHCFVDGWLERFLDMVTDNLDWIEMTTFGEAFNNVQARGRIYLSTASYSEMNEWAMPVPAMEKYEDFVGKLKESGLFEQYEPFVKGGFWRNFQTKYVESNNLHKRMLYVSHLLDEHKKQIEPNQLNSIQNLLYAGQCNCPYWHGVFGGLYLPHLRGAVYQELIAAEAQIQTSISRKSLTAENLDFDFDGKDELIITGKNLKAFVAPDSGAIIELDHLGVAKNLVDIVGRRKEGYHRKLVNRHETADSGTKSIHDLVLVKEEGLEKLLVEDKYRRALFIEHILDEHITAEQFEHGVEGTLLNASGTHSGVTTASSSASARFDLYWRSRSDGSTLEIAKKLTLEDESELVQVEYTLKNTGTVPVSKWFACELGLGSFTFPSTESYLIWNHDHKGPLDKPLELINRSGVSLFSRLYSLLATARLSQNAEIWIHPLWTVSLSEGGFEKVLQGTIIVPRWRILLAPGKSWSVTVSLQTKTKVHETQLSSKVLSEPHV